MQKRKYLNNLFLFTLIVYIVSCKNEVEDNTIPEGKSLAQLYCTSCHSFPEPDLLDRKSWENYILPRMGNMLGVYENSTRKQLLAKDPSASIIYPEESVITNEEWVSIKTYYLREAPIALNTGKDKVLYDSLKLFSIKIPNFKLSPPSTTLLSVNSSKHIILGDAHTESIYEFDNNMKLINTARVRQGAVNLIESDSSYMITVMGSFSPTDDADGFILNLPKLKNKQARLIIDSLRRPVNAISIDLDNDGINEVIVSEFGKWKGRLSLFAKAKNGQFLQHDILNQTGAIKCMPIKSTDDNYPDLISLFGQGNEGFYLHRNKGNLEFETKKIIDLSPAHGSSFFDLNDFNNDGFPDIIYCAGDNADFPPVNKPYHGIYIYLNDGNNKFHLDYFHALNGAYSARVNDFDLDGDLDIAAISFFPDFSQSKVKSFLYLENNNGNFRNYTLDLNEFGRWIIMEASDYDSDGDTDLILGSLAFEVPYNKDLPLLWSQNGIPFIILENNTRQ